MTPTIVLTVEAPEHWDAADTQWARGRLHDLARDLDDLAFMRTNRASPDPEPPVVHSDVEWS